MNLIEAINLCSEHWAGFMFCCVIESTVVFLLLGGLWLLLRRRAWVSAQFGYFLFLLVLVKLIVPGPISTPYLISSFLPEKQIDSSGESTGFGWWWGLFGTGVEGDRIPSPPVNAQESTRPEVQAGPDLSVSSVLMLGWATVVLAFLIRFVWVGRRTRRIFRQTTSVQADQVKVDLVRLQRIAGVKQKVRWVTGPWVQAPMAYGLVRPVIAIPEDMSQRYTPSQMRWILLHELAHIRRADGFVSSFQRILQILFFFHPVVWWANAIIDQLREFACDDAALAGSSANRKDCGEGFLSVVFQTNGLPSVLPATLGMINYRTTIRRRLMRILDSQRKLHCRLSISAGIFLLAVTLIVLPFGGRMAIAQVGEWVKVEIQTGRLTKPISRGWHRMVYDSRRGVIVLHGGGYTGTNIAQNDTWEYDGKTWTRVSTNGPQRYAHSMAYDEERGVTVLCGGSATAGGTPVPGTWEWDGQEWKQVDANLPSRRGIPRMAYDPVRKVVVCHGGALDHGGYNVLSDTWQWDGQTWTQLEDGPRRWFHEMVYDSARGKMVMFGGYESPGVTPTDTWEFDGTHWKCVATEGPEGRCGHSLVFDPSRGVAVLLGGATQPRQGSSAEVRYHDMWEWNGEEWYKLDVTLKPESCLFADMAFDEGRKKIVLFGGMQYFAVGWSSDTWEYTVPGSGMPQALWSLY